jgi:hypothetical protein
VRVDEDDQGQELASDPGEDDRPSADVVGESSQTEQSCEQCDGVRAEHDRRRER